MTYRVVYDICTTELVDAEAAEKFLDFQSTLIAVHGARAAAYWFGPVDGHDVLRLDVDHDSGRAALRWFPDHSHAVEFDPAGPIVVMESSDWDVVTIPAELARVSAETANRAVIEYVDTGQRPTCVQWVPSHLPSGTRPPQT
jgi:hypothetical protein